MTKSVLIVYDRDGWSWDYMAQGIRKYAPPEYDVDIMSSERLSELQRAGTLRKYDACLQMSWPESAMRSLAARNTVLVASHGLEYPWPNHLDKPQARIATRLRNSKTAGERLKRFANVLCVSERLQQLVLYITDDAVFMPPGVDTDLFTPDTPQLDGPLRVGWCGQRGGVTKGYAERLVPIMDRVRSVEFVVNDRSANDALTQAEMVEWYSRIDVFLSTSFSEGCQMPVMEAMACGKPVVATDAGVARALVRNDYTGFLIADGPEEQVIPAIADSLYRLDANPAKRMLLGGNARWLIDTHYSWAVRAPQWLKAICGEAQ